LDYGLLILVGGPESDSGLPGGAVGCGGSAHGRVCYTAEIVTELFGRSDREDGSGQFYWSSIGLGSGYDAEFADGEKIELVRFRGFFATVAGWLVEMGEDR